MCPNMNVKNNVKVTKNLPKNYFNNDFQILTNDDQMLILCLSYFITTVRVKAQNI